MTQSNTEGTAAIPVTDKETDNSAASSTGEKTTSEQTHSSDGDNNQTGEKAATADKSKEDNFADHPRWKEREDNWTKRFNDQETRHVSEIGKLREEIETKYGKKSETADATPSEVPSWFGGDAQQWAEFQNWNKGLLKSAEDNVRKSIEQKGVEEQKKIDEATAYFNETVAGIEADKTLNPQGVKVDRNKLLKFALDNDLVDSKGRWNYRAAYQLMQAGSASIKTDARNEKKQVASASTSENRAETKQSHVTTTDDFKKQENRPW